MARYFDRQAAKAAGYTDEQIDAFLKQQEAPAATPAPAPVAPKITIPEVDEEPKKNLGEKVTDFATGALGFLMPRATEFAKTVGSSLGFSQSLPQVQESVDKSYEQSRQLIEKAKQEKDPEKKKKLLQMSRELDQATAANLEEYLGGFEASMPERYKKEGANEGQYLKDAIGIMGEVGSLAIPAGKVGKAAGVLPKVISAAKTGAAAGALYAGTSPEAKDLAESARMAGQGALIGAAAGGVMSGLYEVPKAAVNKLLKASPGIMGRMFKVNPSERAMFRKATDNMDFEKEIIARDGKSIAGKSYDELINYFNTKKEDAYTAVNEMLSKNTKTVNKSEILGNIEKKIAELAPEKGNVNTSQAITTLRGIAEDLKANPEQLTLSQMNNIKRQLQDAGSAAFLPNGKPSQSSEAFAEIATQVKGLIEREQPDVKDANRVVQLYHLAKDSIERTGDREANKASNDLGQKFMQVLPALIGAGIGAGGGALSGGGLGTIGGLALAGTIGGARLKYFSPETQTRLATALTETLKKTEGSNAAKIADRLVKEISQVAARQSSTLIQPTEEVVQGEDTQGQEYGNVPSDINQEKGKTDGVEGVHSAGIIPQGLQQEQTFQIKDNETGKILTVPASQMAQYGFDQTGKPLPPSVPTRDDILIAMVNDLETTGGKNLSKLNTLLGAVKEESKTKLSAPQLAQIADFDTSVQLVGNLTTVIDQYKDKFGVFKGRASQLNKYDTDAQLVEAQMRTVSQIVGRAMEGGVLRKEDEEKYRRMLPQLTDTPSVAKGKITQVQKMLQDQRNIRAKAFESAGYTTGEGATPTIEEMLGGFAQ